MEAVTQLENQFYISEFHILFTSHSDTVRCECEAYVQVCQSFLFLECTITQSDVTLPPCEHQQNKMSQRQPLILRYRDGSELESLTPDEKQCIKDLEKDFLTCFQKCPFKLDFQEFMTSVQVFVP